MEIIRAVIVRISLGIVRDTLQQIVAEDTLCSLEFSSHRRIWLVTAVRYTLKCCAINLSNNGTALILRRLEVNLHRITTIKRSNYEAIPVTTTIDKLIINYSVGSIAVLMI